MQDPRIQKFAHYLITQAVYLEPGETVLIELHGHAYDLAKALIREAYRAGGKPFLHLFDYTLERALIEGADDAHMAQITSYELAQMKDMDAYIDVRATDNVNEWNSISSRQMDVYMKNYWGVLHLKQRCNHTKWSVLRYPNDAMAQLAGMNTEEYEDFYYKACLVDYQKMGKAMESIVKRLDRTDKVHITGPGTDLTFSVKGIPSIGMHGTRNVPDGEIYTSPVRNSVNGVVTFNTPSPYNGFVFQNVRLEFKDGKVVKASSNSNERINRILDTDKGARYVGEFAIGVNPEIHKPMGDILFDEKISGSFHFTPGNCYDNASNGNHSAIHWDLICIQTPEYGGGEMYFDDTLVRKDGMFVVDDLKVLNPENLR